MDVIILGGGIVGLTLANLLATNSALQLAVIDAKAPELEWDPNFYDIRCSAITRAAQHIFSELEVWKDIIRERCGVYDQMLIWDQYSQQQLHFSANAINEPDLGHIIENRIIQRALYNKLRSKKNVRLIIGAATELQQFAVHNRLRITNESIDCKLIIGADGANSWLRKVANIPAYGWDYGHTALVATIQSELPHNNTARQRFAADGPLAFLPLAANNLSSIVWSSSPSKIQQLLQLSENEFCMRLAAEFDCNLGKLSLHGKRASFPLRMLHSAKYVLPRLALIGDAAHCIHPLAGQGMNLGILDAAALAQVLLQAQSEQRDIGVINVLRKYERARKAHNWGMLALVEVFKRIFASKATGLVNLRGKSMGLINNLDLAKNAMIRFALGTNQNLAVNLDA